MEHVVNKEIKLLIIAVIIALLNVVGHILLSEYFSEFAWQEYSLAAIPLVMFLLCVFAVRSATKSWQQQNREDSRVC